MAISSVLVYILITIVSVFFVYVKYALGYWKRRGIPHDPPSFPEGSWKGQGTKRHFRDLSKELYDKYKSKGPFCGIFFALTPGVLVSDLDLAKDILIKDFHQFADRGLYSNEKDDPLSGHLFAMDGARWRHMRNKLSPTFTSGKMKYMFPTVVSVAEQLEEMFAQLVEGDPVIEMKDVLGRFSTDVIGTCAFGIDCNSLKDPKTEFRVVGSKTFKGNRHGKIGDLFIVTFPKLALKLGVRLMPEDIHQFFMRVVRETVEYREKNSVVRNDFMNLLIEMKNSGEGLTINELAAQAFIFFFAGFETSSTTMGFALFELALNQDIQDKLRAEINEKFDSNDGKFTYEGMTSMHYMEMVVRETLRKYSVNLFLFRKSLVDYQTSNPKFVIPKGLLLLIPADSIHLDPEIYPDPDKFDPERFTPEEIKKRHPIAWLPFGDGPRNCIGLRFGKMQIFTGLAFLLRNFKFYYDDRTPNPIQLNKKNMFLEADGGIYLRVERIRT